MSSAPANASLKRTEAAHPKARGLQNRPDAQILAVLHEAQVAAAQAVAAAIPAIEEAARSMTATLEMGGRLFYVGAGSSALMANADALELAGTFGIDPARVHLVMAGGLPVDSRMPGETEDDAASGRDAAEAVAQGDLVIAVSASGMTPFVFAFVTLARKSGACIVSIDNVETSAVATFAHHAIHLLTPPEVVSGSTRMGAGTAQKIALNMLSTLAFTKAGAVHDGMMVNVVADNIKLRGRARRIVSAIAGVSDAAAEAALAQTGGAVKPAVLVARGASRAEAERLLTESGGHLSGALDHLQETTPNKES